MVSVMTNGSMDKLALLNSFPLYVPIPQVVPKLTFCFKAILVSSNQYLGGFVSIQ